MNLRTLKKLSKRAAPLLVLMGDTRQQFPADRGANHLSRLITARKHWDRSSCLPDYTPHNSFLTPRGRPIKHVTRAGRTMVIRPPTEPRKGTMMVGATSGYYEPEWDEETAWEALSEQVHWTFVDFHPETGDILSKRDFPTPRAIFKGAAEIVAQRKAKAATRS